LLSLIGPTGPPGPIGYTGPTGNTGPIGSLNPNIVAVGNDSTYNLIVSDYGITWSGSRVVTQPTFNIGNSVAWNGAYWLALGEEYNGNCMFRSDDGLHWTNTGAAIFNIANSAVWAYDVGNSQYSWFVVGTTTGLTSYVLATSTDGTNWTRYPLGTLTSANSIAWDASYNTIIVVGDSTDGNPIMHYDHGIWTGYCVYNSGIAYDSFNGKGVVYNGKMWIVVGEDTNHTNHTIFVSGDGDTWDSMNVTGQFSGTEYGLSIAYNQSVWIATGSAGTILYSQDGFTWTSSMIIGTYAINYPYGKGGLTWTGEYWLAHGNPMNISYDNGQTWFNSPNTTFSNFGNGGSTRKTLPTINLNTLASGSVLSKDTTNEFQLYTQTSDVGLQFINTTIDGTDGPTIGQISTSQNYLLFQRYYNSQADQTYIALVNDKFTPQCLFISDSSGYQNTTLSNGSLYMDSHSAFSPPNIALYPPAASNSLLIQPTNATTADGLLTNAPMLSVKCDTINTGIVYDSVFNLPPSYWFNLTDSSEMFHDSFGPTFGNFYQIGQSDPVLMPMNMINQINGINLTGNSQFAEITINFAGILHGSGSPGDVVQFGFILMDDLSNYYQLSTYDAYVYGNSNTLNMYSAQSIGNSLVVNFSVKDTVNLAYLNYNYSIGARNFLFAIKCQQDNPIPSVDWYFARNPVVSITLRPLSYTV